MRPEWLGWQTAAEHGVVKGSWVTEDTPSQKIIDTPPSQVHPGLDGVRAHRTFSLHITEGYRKVFLSDNT